MSRLRRSVTRLAIRWLARRRDPNVPTSARLYWVWEERVEEDRDGDLVYEVVPMAAPAYEGTAPRLPEAQVGGD